MNLIQTINFIGLLSNWRRVLREFVVGCLIAVLAGTVLGAALISAIVLLLLHH